MTRIVIDKLEFYITNVCNLTCSGCNRYNNYKFSGYDDFDQYEHILERWAEKIDIVKAVILGGEPLLNPTINRWVTGLKRIWPDHYSPQIQSNGTRTDLVPGLYQACRSTGCWIGISLHRKQDLDPIVARIRNFLQHPICETQDPNNKMGSNFQFVDANQVKVHVWISDHFVQSNVIEGADGRFRVYNSDPQRAHDNCGFVKFKNYHFIAGEIHKCGPAPLMKQFDQQFGLEVTPEQRQLIYDYRGLSIDEFDQRGAEFFRTIDDPLPQCQFCPESYDYQPITFSALKPNKI